MNSGFSKSTFFNLNLKTSQRERKARLFFLSDSKHVGCEWAGEGPSFLPNSSQPVARERNYRFWYCTILFSVLSKPQRIPGLLSLITHTNQILSSHLLKQTLVWKPGRMVWLKHNRHDTMLPANLLHDAIKLTNKTLKETDLTAICYMCWRWALGANLTSSLW